jgi:hypothetical protein
MMADREGGEVRRLPGLAVLAEKQIGAKPLAQARTLAAPEGQGAAVIGHKLGCTNWGRAELSVLRLT